MGFVKTMFVLVLIGIGVYLAINNIPMVNELWDKAVSSIRIPGLIS